MLNGKTKDFQGHVVGSLYHPDIKSDNSTTLADQSAADTDKLGPLPIGQGRAEPAAAGKCYVSPLLVLAKVGSNSNTLGFTYTWKRVYQDGSWKIKKSADGSVWNVTKVALPTGFPKPIDDTASEEFQTHAPSQKGILYMYDNPGEVLSNYADEKKDDFAYSEVDFTYTLTLQAGDVSKDYTFHVGQTTEAVRTHTTGTVPDDWEGKVCSTYTGNMPSCKIDIPKVRAIVGGTLPINIDEHANDGD